MKSDNKISVTVDWDLEYDEESLNERIENNIVEKATKIYLEKLDKKFAATLEKLLYDQAYKIVKGINKFELDKCNTNGIKETISIENFLIKKSIESLEIKRDSYGRTGSSASNEQRTPIDWIVKGIIEDKQNGFSAALLTEIEKTNRAFQDKLQEMVTKTLTPVYVKLIEKLNS